MALSWWRLRTKNKPFMAMLVSCSRGTYLIVGKGLEGIENFAHVIYVRSLSLSLSLKTIVSYD